MSAGLQVLPGMLLVTDHPFWFRDRGERNRIDALCRCLARTNRVTVCYVGALGAEDRACLAAADYAGLQVVSLQAGGGRWPRLFGFGRCEPTDGEPRLADFKDAAIERQFLRLVAKLKPDTILIEYIRFAYLARAVHALGGARPRLLIDTLDVMWQRCNAFHAVGERHWVTITNAEEREALAGFDAVLAIQDHDRVALQELVPDLPVITVGHAVPVVTHPPRAGDGVRVLFLGTGGAPNRDAMETLIQQVWPAVRSATGGTATLVIAGVVGEKLARSALPAGVEVAGRIEGLDALYAGTDIVVNPVAFGGGLKIKNVEALAHGLPLLTSTIGAQGLDDGAGSAFWVYADHASLCERLVALIRSPQARQDLARAAHTYAARRFSEEGAYGALLDWLRAAGKGAMSCAG